MFLCRQSHFPLFSYNAEFCPVLFLMISFTRTRHITLFHSLCFVSALGYFHTFQHMFNSQISRHHIFPPWLWWDAGHALHANWSQTERNWDLRLNLTIGIAWERRRKFSPLHPSFMWLKLLRLMSMLIIIRSSLSPIKGEWQRETGPFRHKAGSPS